MLNKGMKLLAMAVMVLVLLLSGCGRQNNVELLDAENPVTITIWHYYNGEQQKAFDQMVKEFNETEGLERGIIVESHSYGGIIDLQQAVLDSVNKNVGAEDVPNIFSAYADTAYAVDKKGYVVDISKYMTKEELAKYIKGYIEEGKFGKEEGVKIFPVAKATEVLALNKTDWDKFATATGQTEKNLGTIEGITRISEVYYNWTDGLTPSIKNDGKAFFGRDALANYFFIGSKQLGQDIFSHKDGKTVLNFDEEIAQKLWDNYYIPYVKGYFVSNGRYRSDDVKTGDIIAYVGSTASATYFPNEVVVDDEVSYPIEVAFYQAPKFEKGADYAVQQGAGMVVTNENESKTYASIEFLKWFTEKERNLKFTLDSGYLPVTYEANDLKLAKEVIKQSGANKNLEKLAEVALPMVNNNELYTVKVFEKATDARNILDYSLADKAKEDRAKVVEKINSGASLENAVKEYTADENFQAWYSEVKSELEKCVK